MSPKVSSDLDAVGDYLRTQNRPYSATDIFNNLHKAVGKAAVQKALDQLVRDGTVREKTYGKQKVYAANQSNVPTMDDSQMNQLDEEIRQKTEQLRAEREAFRVVETECRAMEKTKTTAELEAEVEQCEGRLNKAKEKLGKMKSGGNKPVDPQLKRTLSRAHDECAQTWRKRKRLVMDVINTVMESYPKDKRQLLEEIGIETDEEAGVSMPALK